MKIKEFTMFTFLIIGFLFFTSESNAQKMMIPPGSYQNSCQDIKVEGSALVANCNQSGGDKKFKVANKFEDFFMCADDIRNDNGTIKCTKSENGALMKKAETAFEAMFPYHYGLPYAKNETKIWVYKMIMDGNLGWFYKGTENVDANQTMKKYLKTVAPARLVIVNRAFHDVYGVNTDASPTEVAFWNANFDKTNQLYKEVVNAENKKLNEPNNKIVRRAMILFAYKKMMGRVPSKEDFAFWEPKIENYKQIVASGRDWMYSTGGSKELAATVERALTEKSGSKPSAGQINEAMNQYVKTKAIYAEM